MNRAGGGDYDDRDRDHDADHNDGGVLMMVAGKDYRVLVDFDCGTLANDT